MDVFGCTEKGMRGNNLHRKETFERAYRDRDWNWYRALLAECVRHGMPGKWVDLGAGLGLFVECAGRFGIHCVGLEGSEYAVARAKERWPGIDVRQQFLEDGLPFEDGSIATIVCHQTIEHLSRETARFMLKECFRVLEWEGVVLIYSPCRYDPKQKAENTHINLYTPSALKAEMEDIGFRVIASPNSPRELLGDSQIASHLMKVVFRVAPIDYLSATANCIAAKCR